ncbi:MAG TPA: hypothetical protein PKD48_01980 [Sphingopyxis sp.]|nr:hypothetical protein [Sphingopyxis sp.]
MGFVVVDVETANPKFSSICQIGLVRFDRGIEVDHAASIRRLGDGDGALAEETIVFTGELSISRSVAADMAAAAGANVDSGVTKRTTMLVVGERDIVPGWSAKSGKHVKAEALIAKGQSIRIVGEVDFLALAAITD